MNTTLHTGAGEQVSLESGNAIAIITFASEKANSLSGAALQALARGIEQCALDSTVRVIGLQSGGEGAFCAGASFEEFKAIDSQARATEFFMGFARLILAMRRAPKFIVARVHGKAVGGGVGLIAASDVAIASSSASVRLSEFEIGIGPFVIGAAVERRVGAAQFSALAIDCGWRDADWSLQQGLFRSVLPDTAALDVEWHATLQQLSGRSPEATSELKALLWHGTEGWETLLPQRAAVSGRLLKP